MTIEELRAQYPEEIAQVEAEARAAVDTTEAVSAAVQSERARMAEIDEIAGLFAPDQVHEAKYGDAPCTAAELTLRAAKAAVAQGSKFLADANADATASGANAVGAAPTTGTEPEEDNSPEARLNRARAEIHSMEIFKKEDN